MSSSSPQIPQGITGNDALKFDTSGNALYFPGITIICHLPPSGIHTTLHNSIVSACLETPNPILSQCLIPLPTSSLHMTLYDCRSYPQSHPTNSPSPEKEAARAKDWTKFHAAFLELAPEFKALLPFKMRFDYGPHRKVVRNLKPLQVPVRPFDEVEAGKLATMRGMLREAFGIPPKYDGDVDPYKFHITTHYPKRAMTDEEVKRLKREWDEKMEGIEKEVGGTFEIDRIELCTFESMLEFEVKETVRI